LAIFVIDSSQLETLKYNPMMPEISLILISFILGWLLVLTILLIRIFTRYYRLTREAKKEDLGSILEKILKENTIRDKEVKDLFKRLEVTEKDVTSHIQKIGLVRFNPFTDTGGNQSFALAVLDGNDSGIVISGLHSRDNTRLYTKLVKKGKPVKHDFSKEETEAISQARKQ
jgi:hypothetical protein